jgi:large subunit ribosomal protein L25
VKLFIPVEFVNADTCPGIKKGGTLTVVRNEVELDVLAGDIPDHLTIDLANHEMGDTIHISEVTMPEGAKSVIDRDFVIANIAAPRTMVADDDEATEEAPAEAAAE